MHEQPQKILFCNSKAGGTLYKFFQKIAFSSSTNLFEIIAAKAIYFVDADSSFAPSEHLFRDSSFKSCGVYLSQEG